MRLQLLFEAKFRLDHGIVNAINKIFSDIVKGHEYNVYTVNSNNYGTKEIQVYVKQTKYAIPYGNVIKRGKNLKVEIFIPDNSYDKDDLYVAIAHELVHCFDPSAYTKEYKEERKIQQDRGPINKWYDKMVYKNPAILKILASLTYNKPPSFLKSHIKAYKNLETEKNAFINSTAIAFIKRLFRNGYKKKEIKEIIKLPPRKLMIKMTRKMKDSLVRYLYRKDDYNMVQRFIMNLISKMPIAHTSLVDLPISYDEQPETLEDFYDALRYYINP